MTVYVDEPFEATPENAQARRHGTSWCHMIADTEDELHAMARRLGLKRSYFQHNPRTPWHDHYDLVPSKRTKAIEYGAKAIDSHEFGKMLLARGEAYRASLVGNPWRDASKESPDSVRKVCLVRCQKANGKMTDGEAMYMGDTLGWFGDGTGVVVEWRYKQ